MHRGLELEARALSRSDRIDRGALFAQRKSLVMRLVAFYFVAFGWGTCNVAWDLWVQQKTMHDDFVATTVLAGLATLRLICLQRRYHRLRSAELELELAS